MQYPLLILITCLLLVAGRFKFTTQALSYEVSQKCNNPNDRTGVCISIYECPTILAIIRNKWSSKYGFARQSECSNGRGRRPYVCCTSDTGFVDRTQLKSQRIIFPSDDEEKNSYQTSTRRQDTSTEIPQDYDELFPKPPVCGPISLVNKIYGGEEAELGEFPWLVNLEHKKANGDLVSVCAGNIINHRYVLTAAHCIKGKIEEKVGKVVSVRVGDHNTQTQIDCNNFGCIDPFQRLNVERIIVHKNFNTNPKIYNIHDIALIRTDRPIIYTDTVAPVCLPNVLPNIPQLRNGMKLSVAGWGHNGTVKYTASKQKVEVPYVENNNCPYLLADEQLCAGGEYRKDSCTGDSGGALTRLSPEGWWIEGLVSYGRGCGLETPAIYTRIRSYIDWIRSNMEP
ncbi:serine protease 7 [Musca domestica]|uniref:CLIP domain-containing serine protease n=1 Tax=Musca domestica TaxID=7370 RepID=A0A9J7CV32_MUSDO|nr:serine protease 7 [Musca domestica]